MGDLKHILDRCVPKMDPDILADSAADISAAMADIGGAASLPAAEPTPALPLDREFLDKVAEELDLTQPGETLLSEEDKADVALLGWLSKCSAHVQQLLGVQVELTERATWNYLAASQLGSLTQVLERIPFDVDSGASAVNPPVSSEKGKESAVPKKRLFHKVKLQDAKDLWFSKPSESPLPSCISDKYLVGIQKTRCLK